MVEIGVYSQVRVSECQRLDARTDVTDLVYKKQDVWNYSQTTVGSPETPVPGALALPSTTIPADVRRPVLTLVKRGLTIVVR